MKILQREIHELPMIQQTTICSKKEGAFKLPLFNIIFNLINPQIQHPAELP